MAHNWRLFQRLAEPGEAGAVVKADAYGLGAGPCAQALAAAGARCFFTASVAEAQALRTALGPAPEICALNGAAGPEFAAIAGADLTVTLNDPASAQAWIAAGRPGRAPIVHLDTGMRRLGAAPQDWAAIAALDLAPSVVMSHLACADAPGDPRNAAQRSRFQDGAALFPAARRSLAASAGALLGPAYQFDLTRPGIGLYGAAPARGASPALAVVATLSAPILQIRQIEAGEEVGYGATFAADRPMTIAAVAIGYADGLLRSASGLGYAALNGRRRAILGRISMDLIMIDVSEGDAAPGDEVELIGPTAALDEAAASAGTIPYEVLTALKQIRRRYHGAAR